MEGRGSPQVNTVMNDQKIELPTEVSLSRSFGGKWKRWESSDFESKVEDIELQVLHR